jgi:hypothetical protein
MYAAAELGVPPPVWTSADLLEAGIYACALFTVFRWLGVASAMRLERPPLPPKVVKSYTADEELMSLAAARDQAKDSLSNLPLVLKDNAVFIKPLQALIDDAEAAVSTRLEALHSQARSAWVVYYEECSRLINGGFALSAEFKRQVLLHKVMHGLI